MSKSKVAEAYENLLAAAQAYAEAVAEREIQNLGKLPRVASRNIAVRLAEFLAAHPNGAHDITDVAREFGIARPLMASAARRLVRSGTAMYARRRTAVRLRAKPTASVQPEDAAQDLGDTLTPEQIARRDELMTWLLEQARLGRNANDVFDERGDDPLLLDAYSWLLGTERIAEDDERRLVVLPAPEAT